MENNEVPDMTRRCSTCKHGSPRSDAKMSRMWCLGESQFRGEFCTWADGWCPRWERKADWADKAVEWIFDFMNYKTHPESKSVAAARLREFAKEAKP